MIEQMNRPLAEVFPALRAGAEVEVEETVNKVELGGRKNNAIYFADGIIAGIPVRLAEHHISGGFTIRWTNAPACADCRHCCDGRCWFGNALASDGDLVRDVRADSGLCGPRGTWFERLEQDGYCDVPVEPAGSGDGLLWIKYGGDQQDIVTIAAHQDFMGYIYESDDKPRSESILWMDGGGELYIAQLDDTWTPVRPGAVRMRVGEEE